MPEPPDISIDLLRACLKEQYGLVAVTLEFLPRGYDCRAGVYRVVGVNKAASTCSKPRRGPLYEPGCLVPRYLYDQGITTVVVPLPAASGWLWIRLEQWTVMLYPFLAGETSVTGMTDQQWREIGRIFRRIHQVQLPADGFPSMRQESFDATGYLRWVREFKTQHVRTPSGGSGPAETLRAAWVAHQSTIHTAITSLERFSTALRMRALPAVIAHADLHPANLLRDAAGHVFVLDWDEVMLAPKERDFIFIREPQAHALWQGYGLLASEENETIDWVALTYFRWERVVQDLIEEAEQVLFRDHVSQAAKATAANRFAATFAAGGNVEAAYAAASHLP